MTAAPAQSEETVKAVRPLQFAYWTPHISGGFVASKIPSTTSWTPDYNAKVAEIAERHGFEYALTLVRFMASHSAEFQHESVSFSQYLLSKTTKLKVIAAILPGPWNPTLAAKQIASIDHYHGGRVAVNVVSGFYKAEFVAINEPWLEHGERYRRSEEFIRVIKGLWSHTKPSFTFHGNFYQYNSYTLQPKPLQQPHPEVFQGGNSLDARAMAARVSDVLLLNGQSKISDFKMLVEDTRRLAKEVGREKEIRFGVNAFVILRDTEEEAIRVWRDIVGQADAAAVKQYSMDVQQAGRSSKDGKGMWSDSSLEDLVQYNDGFKPRLIGTARQIADRILLFKALGITVILTSFLNYEEDIDAFGDKVIPLIRQGEKDGRGTDLEHEMGIEGYVYQS